MVPARTTSMPRFFMVAPFEQLMASLEPVSSAGKHRNF
jgi:hypothetical protein